jgi:allantoate deiminase
MTDFQRTFEERIEALAALSESPDNLTRPSYTPSMRRANDLVASWMQAAGMTTREDSVGNLIGRYEGTQPNAKALLFGSHLDTVIDAGKYDGTLGVLLGLAVIEHFAKQDRKLPFALEVIAFADEEGLRFHLPYIGSRAFNGTLKRDQFALADEQGVSIAQAIEDFGGSAIASSSRQADEFIGYIEAHIEQGPLLEAEEHPVGIVSAIAGQHRAQLTFIGEAGHAGTVPMRLRRDALLAAARFVERVSTIGNDVEGLVATVGQLQVFPGASNAVPGKVVLSLDVRHADDAVLYESVRSLFRDAGSIASLTDIRLDWKDISVSPSVACSPRLVELLSSSIEGKPLLNMVSGAGHDAVQMAKVTDIAMLFVRCKGGISHNSLEFCASEDAEVALGVMIGAVEKLAESYQSSVSSSQ